MRVWLIGRVIIISLLILVCCLTPSAAGRSLFQKIVDTASDVIIGGVKFGLDEAGSRLLGPTAWNGFKRVISPVIRRLQKRFPGLSFDSPGDKVAVDAANEAVQYLKQDKELQKILVDNFTKLAEGQQDILAGINRLERVTEKTLKDVGDIKKTVEEIREELKEAKPQMEASELPTWVDVSDLIEHYYLYFETRARRRGEVFNKGIVTTIVIAIGIVTFDQIVCEKGRSYKLYKSEIGGGVVTAIAYPKYGDKLGRQCRRITIDSFQFGKTQRRVVTHWIMCREEGRWKNIKMLGRSEY